MKNFLLIVFSLFFLFSAGFVYASEESAYDFSVESVVVAPSSPKVGQDCRITVKIKNKGVKNLYTAAGLSSYQFDFGDFTKTSEEIPSPTLENVIWSGEYFEYVFEGKYNSEGAQNVSFTLESYNEVEEDNKDNNYASTAVTVYGTDDVDISIYSFEIDTDDILVNEEVEITVNIKNTGKVSLINSLGISSDEIITYFDGFDIDEKNIEEAPSIDNPFNPGETYQYKYTGRFTEYGDHELGFQVDRRKKLLEFNEDNNYLATSTYVYLTEEERDDFDISNISYNLISSSSVKILWDSSKKANSRVDYRKKFHNSDVKQIENSKVVSHNVTLENLDHDSLYTFRVVSENGTVIKSSDYFDFTTPANDNVKVLLDPGMSNDSNSGNPVITWMTNLISDSKVYYKLSDESDYQLKSSSSLTDKHIVDLGDLPAGLYHYYVVSNSSVGTSYQSDLDSFLLKSDSSATEETETNNTETTTNTTTTTETNTNNQTSAVESNVASETDISNTSLYNSLKGKIILQVEASGEAYYVHPDNQKMYYLGRPDDAFNVMRELGLGISEANYSSFNGVAPASLRGKILLRVEANGEAYYVNPVDLKMHYLGRPADAFNVMRELGLGISNSNFESL